MRIKLLTLLAIACISSSMSAQNKKVPVGYNLYDKWKSLSAYQISDDGNWLTWVINPQTGDGQLYLKSWGQSESETVINRGAQPNFSPNSDFLAFRIVPQSDTIRQAKIRKVKSEKMPKDSLGIYLLSQKSMLKYPNVKSFKTAEESASWIAFQLDETKSVVKPEKRDSAAGTPKGDGKSNKKPEFNGLPVVVLNPITKDSFYFPDVTEYNFSKHGNWLYMVSIKEDSIKTSTVRLFNTKTGSTRELWVKTGVIKGLISDEEGTQLAFLYSEDTSKSKKYVLYRWTEKTQQPELIVDAETTGMPSGSGVSENGRLAFSPDGNRIFFSTSRKPESFKEDKDTLLADDRVLVDIWHWQEEVLQSIQLKQVEQERKKSYQAVFNIRKKQMVQLADSSFIENYRLVRQGDGDLALGFCESPYKLYNSIRYTSTKDVYLTNLNDGSDIRIFSAVEFSPQLSPEGKYLYWWEPADSSWYCYHVREKLTVNLTSGLPVEFSQEPHDTPDDPGSYGIMGWSAEDSNFFVYDQYDIWMLDPAGKQKPVCLTGGWGRKNDCAIRYISLDPEEKYLDPDKSNLFSLRNIKTKESGFCRFAINNPVIKPIILSNNAYGRPVKSKNAEKLLWTRNTVKEFPDFWCSDLNFSNQQKISNANPQQAEFIWADVELVEWRDLNGKMHQGLLYKPEDLDPSQKYPMIVYFYERHSDGLHTYYYPRASASTVNPLEYASNGYLIFMPDIHFEVGLPGKSFYNAIMSGIMDLSKRSYVDMDRLGIQGQSWGGYGTAYMITQTGIFKAASPGAPVSNMTSAYGGIRTESGMVRQFQYEKTQSRIGGTLWEKPEYFIENSPLFYADRISTPCLIRHDDADGAVPFSEGVQLYVALRRLQKPAWLINYNNQPHNLTRLADKKDWSVRMMQFFDHYLKGKTAPAWMTDGVRAVDKKQSETFYRNYTEK